MGTEKERKDTQQATLYELRRLLKNSGKESYTVEELCELLDTIADAKAQEYPPTGGRGFAPAFFVGLAAHIPAPPPRGSGLHWAGTRPARTGPSPPGIDARPP